MHRLLVIIACSLTIWTLPARAQDMTDQEDQIVDLLPPSRCPALFGSPAAKAENRALRQQKLDSIAEKAHTINLLYSCNWKEPRPIHLHGLELVDIETLGDAQDEDAERRAIVRYDADVGDLDCPSGYYPLEVDDSIGDDLAVLAVLDDVVLLRGELGLVYLAAERGAAPVFRMIWRSSWKMIRLPDQRNVRSNTTRSHRKRRARRRSPRHRRR